MFINCTYVVRKKRCRYCAILRVINNIYNNSNNNNNNNNNNNSLVKY